jgi:hypothetical protein
VSPRSPIAIVKSAPLGVHRTESEFSPGSSAEACPLASDGWIEGAHAVFGWRNCHACGNALAGIGVMLACVTVECLVPPGRMARIRPTHRGSSPSCSTQCGRWELLTEIETLALAEYQEPRFGRSAQLRMY